MKILIIGKSGIIGKAVSKHLENLGHEVVGASRSTAPALDISSSTSIRSYFEEAGSFNSILCIAGEAKWALMDNMTEDDYYIGIRSKLMGQVNLVRIGKNYLSERGSITLSTGMLADSPVPLTTSAAMVNGAIHSFVLAAQKEINSSYRLNVVSLGLVKDSYEAYKDFFIGFEPISMEKAAKAYELAVQGKMSGEIIRVYR